MDDEKIKRLNEFLSRHNTTCEILPAQQVRHLIKIDDALQERLGKIKEAEAVIKSQRISVQAIAEDTQLARKTFYNNTLLRQYVEYFATKVSAEATESKEQIKDLKGRISTLEDEVRKFLMRDWEIETVKQELEATQQMLAQKQKENERIQAKYEALLSEKTPSSEKPRGKVLVPRSGNISSFFRDRPLN